MKLGFIAVVAVISLIPMANVQAQGVPAGAQKLRSANDGFAFDLLKQVAKDQPEKNIFISPYSASTVLQMVSCGAAGRTRKEMESVLGTTGITSEALGEANRRVSQSLNTAYTNVILTTANAIWYRRDFAVRQEFLALNTQFFGATVAPINFADPGAADTINAWANEKTHGRIPRIADGMIDPVYSRLFLANAVYFKGKWADPFMASDTKERPFHLRDGSTKNVPLMKQEQSFTYRHGTGYQAVRLPYEDSGLAMYVFLPDDHVTVEQVLGILNGNRWQRVTEPGFEDREGLLMLPRFKLDYNVDLMAPLKAMGMKTAFDQTNANFSGMSGEQLYISAALQKAFVEVKEEGTEAAAVTANAVTAASLEPPPPPKPFTMIVDKPFLFLIVDNQTETILFMGLVFDPPVDQR